MKRAEFGSFIAGVIVSCLLVSYAAPSAYAFKVFVPNPNGGLPITANPNGSGPFCKWNFQSLADGKIPYWINKKGSDDLSLVEVRTGLDQSFNAWKAVEATNIDFSFAGFTVTNGFSNDGKNVISWDENGKTLNSIGVKDGEALAVTIPSVDTATGEIRDVDIVFNGSSIPATGGSCSGFRKTSIRWNLAEQHCAISIRKDEYLTHLQSTATHEIGHLLGLAHSDVVGATMSTRGVTPSFENSTEQSTLEADDRAGLMFLYADFLSFVEGAPASAGDGLTITPDGGQFFNIYELSPHYSLASTTNGLTLSIFSDNIASLSHIQVNLNQDLPPPCEGGPSTVKFSVTSIVLNGVPGRYINITQAELQSLVDSQNQFQLPECRDGKVSDYFVTSFSAHSNQGNIIQPLDAAVIRNGVDNFPGTVVP